MFTIGPLDTFFVVFCYFLAFFGLLENHQNLYSVKFVLQYVFSYVYVVFAIFYKWYLKKSFVVIYYIIFRGVPMYVCMYFVLQILHIYIPIPPII